MRYLTWLGMTACLISPQETPNREAASAAATQPAASQPASAPAPGRAPQQSRVLTELLQQTERPAAIPAQPTRASSDNAAAAPKNDLLALEGTVWERAGRLIRNGERSEFRFVSPDKPELTQSLELLPNSWLEYLEREADGGATDFVITAEVTRYRGRNFLIIRNYRRQVAHNNLSP